MKLCISPCPNDTFAFYALIHKKIDLLGLEFNVEFQDIDKLNQTAIKGDADCCKVSAAVTKKLLNYQILNSGAAIGYGNAPLLVAKRGFNKQIEECKIAIPGLDTTAYALLQKFYPKVKKVQVSLFSDIMELVEDGSVDCGVIIHEGRFVYAEKELQLVADFGSMWNEKFKMPIPLGCIVAKSDLMDAQKVDAVIKSSILYAMAHRNEVLPFVAFYAQELSKEVQAKHIDYFVNDFTVDMGDIGRRAIGLL